LPDLSYKDLIAAR
jgi:radial spoke head protein 4A